MATNPIVLAVELTKEREVYERKAAIYVKDPEILESKIPWVNLYPLGFLNYVLFADGRVVKLTEGGYIQRFLKLTGRGHAKNLSVTFTFRGCKPEQYFVHILMAYAFLPREGLTGRRIKFIDGDNRNLALSNLAWD